MQIDQETHQARFASVDDFIDYQLGGRLANAVRALSAEALVILVDTLRTAFEPYVSVDGLAFPLAAHIGRAKK